MCDKRFFGKFIIVSIVLWVVFGLMFYQHLSLLGMVFIAFVLGLRHGFDVDHIVAIDNITRKLAASDKPSITIGLFFALGHSTVVFLLTFFVILGVSLTQTEKVGVLATGALVGSIVSITFLWLTASMNVVSLYHMVRRNQSKHLHSPLAHWLRPIFKLIDKPYKMYPVGFLFGLGFDTATEIALLGLAASVSLQGESIWLILCLPIAFALGMTWVDSLDAIIMTKLVDTNSLNSSKYKHFNITVLLIVIFAAFSVGFIQLFSLIGIKMYDMVGFVLDYSPWFGAAIVLILLLLLIFMCLKESLRITPN